MDANAGPCRAALTSIEGGVCATAGVTAAGVAAGLRPGHPHSGRLDLALVDAGRVVGAAVVQTTNQVRAAPVQLTARHSADGRARAVVLNAGNANACTGAAGLAAARDSAVAAATALGCHPTDVLVCSTGVIGVPLAHEALIARVPALVGALSRDGGGDAARAVMTTDTVAKQAAMRVTEGAATCVVGGFAKGSGMIAPELATMLCVLTTDAAFPSLILTEALRAATSRTFGRVSVDECRSTNDAVILLATGGAPAPPSLAAFRHGLTAVCAELAEAVVRDGEGASRLLRVTVTGASEEEAALGVARAIAGSVLVRTALAGGDPNWGRVLAAVGAGPVPVDPGRIRVVFGRETVCQGGVVAPFDLARAVAALRGPEVELTVDLGLGSASATILTCDLTHDYVTINAEYTT